MAFDKIIAVALSGSIGLLGIALVSVIISGKFGFLSTGLAIEFNTNLQLSLMLVTLYKFGADTVILARCAGAQVDYDYRYHYKKLLPLLALAFPLLLLVLGAQNGTLLGFAALLDVYSVLKVSEFNAKRRFVPAAMTGVFYIPLACVLLIGLQGVPGAPYLALAVASVARCSYVVFAGYWARQEEITQRVVVPALSLMVSQQALNFLMFRSDQMVIGYLHKNHLLSSYISDSILWAKAVEFHSAATLVLTAVVFPQMATGLSASMRRLAVLVRLNWLYMIGTVALALVVFAGLAVFLIEGGVDSRAAPFFLQALLVVPANLVTFMLFRANKVGVTVAASLAALALTLVVVAALYLAGMQLPVLYMGFTQLLLYILFASFFDANSTLRGRVLR